LIREVDPDDIYLNISDLGDSSLTETLENQKIWVGLVNSTIDGNVFVTAKLNNGTDGSNYGSIIIDNEKPIVEIIRPKSGLYINDNRVISVGNLDYSFVIGDITITSIIYDENGVESVDWYVNEVHIDFNGENKYQWFLDKDAPFLNNGINTIKVIVRDKAGNINSDSIRINKFIF